MADKWRIDDGSGGYTGINRESGLEDASSKVHAGIALPVSHEMSEEMSDE